MALMHIMPAIERLMIHIDELKGFAKCTAPVALNKVELDNLENALLELAKWTEEVQLQALDIDGSFKSFTLWLQTVCAALEDEAPGSSEMVDVENVSRYIRQYLISDEEFGEPVGRPFQYPSQETSDYISDTAGRLNGIYNVILDPNPVVPADSGEVKVLCTFKQAKEADDQARQGKCLASNREVQGAEFIAVVINIETIDVLNIFRRRLNSGDSVACFRMLNTIGEMIGSVASVELFDDEQLILLHETLDADGRTSLTQISTFAYQGLPYAPLDGGIDSDLAARLVNAEAVQNLPTITARTTVTLDHACAFMTGNGSKATIAVLDRERRRVSVLEQNQEEDEE
ncbi:hypothetical protein HKX48_004817 [Thoreauomyces humboldtii]|nr:hypothetical protein HKX48_004817 [Thoreauomyces humboldtii]